jgi:hypothetical protein
MLTSKTTKYPYIEIRITMAENINQASQNCQNGFFDDFHKLSGILIKLTPELQKIITKTHDR